LTVTSRPLPNVAQLTAKRRPILLFPMMFRDEPPPGSDPRHNLELLDRMAAETVSCNFLGVAEPRPYVTEPRPSGSGYYQYLLSGNRTLLSCGRHETVIYHGPLNDNQKFAEWPQIAASGLLGFCE